MVNECNSVMSHGDLITFLAQYLRRNNNTVWTEFRLPDKRIADLLVRCTDGAIEVYECKTRLGNDELGSASMKYFNWCNRLYVAGCNLCLPQSLLRTATTAIATAHPSLGIVTLNRCTYEIRKPARTRPMDADRRRRLDDWLFNHPWNMPGVGGQLIDAAQNQKRD